MRLPNRLSESEKRWVEARVKMGMRRTDAVIAVEHRDELIAALVAQKARTHFSLGRILHLDRLHRYAVRYDQDDPWAAFLDTLPRRPHRFLAMVAEIERRRAVAELVAAKRAKGKARHLKRHRR